MEGGEHGAQRILRRRRVPRALAASRPARCPPLTPRPLPARCPPSLTAICGTRCVRDEELITAREPELLEPPGLELVTTGSAGLVSQAQSELNRFFF